MSILQLLILILIVSIVYALVSFISNEWFIHVNMAKTQNCSYGYTSFKTFLKEFNKYNKWKKDYTCGKISFRGENPDYMKPNAYYIYSSIIKFNGVCMILYPISYIKFLLWCKNEEKEFHIKPKKIQWKNKDI